MSSGTICRKDTSLWLSDEGRRFKSIWNKILRRNMSSGAICRKDTSLWLSDEGRSCKSLWNKILHKNMSSGAICRKDTSLWLSDEGRSCKSLWNKILQKICLLGRSAVRIQVCDERFTEFVCLHRQESMTSHLSVRIQRTPDTGWRKIPRNCK